MPLDTTSTEYINSTDYKVLELRIKDLKAVSEDLVDKSIASRKLRFAEVDIESERQAEKLQPDELYVPQHVIDTNIRREQSSYVQYITQSPRAVIVCDAEQEGGDYTLLEKDLTKKLRFKSWQLSQFANIDCFQANGYSVMEVVYDEKAAGGISHEMVNFEDFTFITDTRNIQLVEMCGRAYYYPKTKLIELCGNPLAPKEKDWNRTQVDKIVNGEPSQTSTVPQDTTCGKQSLYKVFKVMFRVQGIVHVAWVCPDVCDDWVRAPRALYIGRRKLVEQNMLQKAAAAMLAPNAPPPSEAGFETEYPFIVYQYLISENDTIADLKGRVFLDQDTQEAVSSLLSSTVTKARRSAGIYFSKDTSDPNDDLLLQKNVFFKSGCLINSKVTEFQLTPPDPSMFGAIQSLVASNQNETSQVNFAVNNRKDSRKTAKEIDVADRQSNSLTTVQVVLYSLSLSNMYNCMVEVIQSRVAAGLIQVTPQLKQQYARKLLVKPSGDVDVIERQQLIQTMMSAWPVMKETPAGQPFLMDMIEKMFPENSMKYLQAFQQAQVQAQSQQAQQQQMMMQTAMTVGNELVELSKHKEFFSDSGVLHAFPVIQQFAVKFSEMLKGMKQPQQGAVK